MQIFKILLTSICLLGIFSAQSQDIDTKTININSNAIAKNPLPKEYTTYSSKVSNPNGLYTNTALNRDYIALNNFKKVQKGGHFFVDVALERFKGNSNFVNNTSKSKDKAGKETTNYSYLYSYTYSLPVKVTVLGTDGSIITEEYVGSSTEEQTFKTSSYSTSSAASAYWNGAEGAKKRAELKKSAIENGMAAAKRFLQWNYDAMPTKYNVYMEVTDSKKVVENEEFNKQFVDTRATLESMTSVQPIAEVRAKLAPAFKFFEETAGKYTNKEEKSHRKIRNACLWNLAIMHTEMEEYDKAEGYAKECITLDVMKRKAEDLVKLIGERKSLLEKNGIKTYHFPIGPPADAVAPATNFAEGGDEPEGSDAGSVQVTIYPAYMITERGRIEGEIEIEQRPDGKEDFRPIRGNVKFVKINGEGRIPMSFDPKTFSEFGFDKRVFYPGDGASDPLGIMDGSELMVKELVFDSPKIKTWKVYLAKEVKERWEADGNYMIGFSKGTEKKINLMAGLKWLNFNKGLAGYFEDCPSVSAKAKAGDYKEGNIVDMVTAARDYSECK